MFIPIPTNRYGLGLLIALLGVGAMFVGCEELTLASGSSATPQPRSCAELASSGWGGNPHVELTDFLFTTDFVYEERGRRWEWVYIPAIPFDEELIARIDAQVEAGETDVEIPLPRTIRVIVKVRAGSVAELERIEDQDTLRGMVINDIASLDSQTRGILQSQYGSRFDASRCVIYEVGRSPGSSAFGLVTILFGLVLIGGGGALLVGFADRLLDDGPPPRLSRSRRPSGRLRTGAGRGRGRGRVRDRGRDRGRRPRRRDDDDDEDMEREEIDDDSPEEEDEDEPDDSRDDDDDEPPRGRSTRPRPRRGPDRDRGRSSDRYKAPKPRRRRR